MFAVGIIPIIVAVLRHGSWGVAPTIGALFSVFALRSLLVARVVRWRDRGKSKQSGLTQI